MGKTTTRFLQVVGLAGLLLYAAVLNGGRYEIVGGPASSVVRLDRLTGEMRGCDLDGCWNVENGRP